jgi:RsiW-degrading membrane proteinase PrsW (M82 family)
VGLLYYFWHRDKGEKEPMPLMRKVFLWGILVIIPVIVIELILMAVPYYLWADPPLIYWVLMPFICVALPEEAAKLFVVKKFAYDHAKFNEIMDGITYCIIASMGFAMLENVVYTFEFGIGIGILRAFTAVPAHALFSGIMGYYIGVAKFTKDPEVVKKLFYKGLIWGVVLHGLYDFLLMSGIPLFILLVLPLLIFMWIYLHRLIKKANGAFLHPTAAKVKNLS